MWCASASPEAGAATGRESAGPCSIATAGPFQLVNGAIMKILLRDLSRETTEAELLALFGEYGAVQYCKLVMDKVTGKSKGFGFVEMPRAGQAKVAIRALNAQDIGGNRIRVKKAEQSGEGAAARGPEAAG